MKLVLINYLIFTITTEKNIGKKSLTEYNIVMEF